jgi:D-glycero-alpha-D-manno-heptose-7-phosphate kinase
MITTTINGGVKTIVPFRVCDLGGWTDTWFSKTGNVLNLGVLCRYFGANGPYRGIRVVVSSKPVPQQDSHIAIEAADPWFDQQIPVSLLSDGDIVGKNLLLAGISLIDRRRLEGHVTEIDIASIFPPGGSVGTSASVNVGTIAALNAHYECGMTKQELAQTAWRAETEVMHAQSGTQDQYSAAFGYGVNAIAISKFPQTDCREVIVSNATRKSLEKGLITVYYGQHDSSAMHQRVIRQLEGTKNSPILQTLRGLAKEAEGCLRNNDLVGFGKVMQKNTEAQRELCDDLVSHKANAFINIGRHCGAIGWKVNGAGGSGGSISILFRSRRGAVNFYTECRTNYTPELGYLYFEHQLSKC